MTRMYRVKVEFCGTNRLYVYKYIQIVRVISIGTTFATVSPWPEFYGSLANTKIPRSQLHFTLEGAQRAAEQEAAILVKRLKEAADLLESPAVIKDTTCRISEYSL